LAGRLKIVIGALEKLRTACAPSLLFFYSGTPSLQGKIAHHQQFIIITWSAVENSALFILTRNSSGTTMEHIK